MKYFVRLSLFLSLFFFVGLAIGNDVSAMQQMDEEISFDEPGQQTTAKPQTSPAPVTPQKKKAEPVKGQTEKVESKPVHRARIQEVIPDNALLILQTPYLAHVETAGKTLLTNVGMGVMGPVDYLKMTAYSKSLSAIDMKYPAAIVYVACGEKLAMLTILPVSNDREFVRSLGGDLTKYPDSIPQRTPISLRRPADSTCWFDRGYAIIASSALKSKIEQQVKRPASGRSFRFLPPAFRGSLLSLEVTPTGIHRLSQLSNTALADAWRLINKSEKTTAALLDGADPAMAIEKISNLVSWASQNVSQIRVDFMIQAKSIMTATTFLPLPESEFAQQNRDAFTPLFPTSFDFGRFLKVVPEYAAPVSGQADILPYAAAKLPSPFNRVRHLEYSLALPGQNEYAAESWAFFLEVDDSEAFVRELIVPKAQLIGSHIGSKQLSELGAQILGNLAVRRQSRQTDRTRAPIRPANPEGAAELGARLGGQLGATLGSAVGEKQAMALHSFNGYPMLISDLVLYTKNMREIRAEQMGLETRDPLVLTGEPSLRILISRVLAGLQSGSLEGMIQDTFMNQTGKQFAGTMPLWARRNLVVLLDPQHLLIVPGNEALLSEALNQWEQIKQLFPTPTPPPQDPDMPQNPLLAYPGYLPESLPGIVPAAIAQGPAFSPQWDSLRREILGPDRHQLRAATEIDAGSVQIMGDILRDSYFPNLPRRFKGRIDPNTPPLLSVTSVANGIGYLYSDIPYPLLKNLLALWLEEQKNTEK